MTDTQQFVPSSDLSAYNDKNFTKLINSQLETAATHADFYDKLVTLKNDQKKQLLFMQELYDQKTQLKKEIEKSENTLDQINQPPENHFNHMKNDNNYKYLLNSVSAYENLNKYPVNTVILGENDNISINTKPPACPNSKTSVSFQKSVDFVEPPLSQVNLERSLNDGIKKIETMWDNFSLNDSYQSNMRSIEFNERFEKKLKKAQLNKKKPTVQVEWVPRVTIPKPFSMSVREQIKHDYKKENCINEMRDEREKRIEAEILECKKKFRARPVPAHVKKPLFSQAQSNEDIRKQRLREMKNEYSKKVSTLNENYSNKLKDSKTEFLTPNNDFNNEKTMEYKANPMPNFYYNENADEEIKENELYKEINKQMRALEMLKQSKLPNNMGLMEEKKTLEIERNQLFISEMNRLHQEMNDKELQNANLRKSHDVPDFDEQYKNFTIQLEKRKAYNRKNTTAVPFNLRTKSRTGCRNNVCATTETSPQKSNAGLNRSSSSMSRLNRSLSMSMDSMPIKYTESQRLRESTNKGKISEIARKEMQQEHIEKMKSIRQKKMQDQINEKASQFPSEVDKNIERQTRKLKLDQKRQEEEYEQQIADMGKKVGNRKLQIEQIDEENKRRALAKKYSEALKRAGINDIDAYDTQEIHVAKPISSTLATDDWVNE